LTPSQEAEHPGILHNRGNEYLHYEDDWYIIAARKNEYVFIYYKGNNDAWQGYGGATVYTRESTFPDKYAPEMRAAAAKVGLKWDDFTLTDNTCKAAPPKQKLQEVLAGDIESGLKSFSRGFTVIETGKGLRVGRFGGRHWVKVRVG